MKRLVLSVFLTLASSALFAQWNWGINFENPFYLDHIYRDTISNPNCTWQMGHPAKTVFDSSYSLPNAIVTDTLNPVLPNDTSAFYLVHQRDTLSPFHVFTLHFWYRLDGDSSDFGMIEISPDEGLNWVNMLTQDSAYQLSWTNPKPDLRGSSNGWQHFGVDMSYWSSGLAWGGTFPIPMVADTVLFRFTYITGSDTSAHDGWIMDDFYLDDWWEGREQDNPGADRIRIFPNPVTYYLNIAGIKAAGNSRIQILNCNGQLVYEDAHFRADPVETMQLSNGIYILKYADDELAVSKIFVVNH